MKIPEQLRYTKDHEWIDTDGKIGRVGITDFAQDELGEIVFVELPEVGTQLTKGDTLCVVESTKAASDVYAPVSGTVKEVNAALLDAPDEINSSPYEKGWIAVLENIEEDELGELLDSSDYEELISAED